MLKIGWSKRDVSTMEPVLITGQFHARVSKGVLDPIMVYCLVLEDGSDLVVFLSGDFVGGRGIALDGIRKKVSEKRPGFLVEKILFNVTHTHCGPGLMVENPWKDVPHEELKIADPATYFAFFIDQVSDAVLEAYDSRAEGAIAYGQGFAFVGNSRRTTYYDDYAKRNEPDSNPEYGSLSIHGHAVMYGTTNDNQFAGFENGADHYINLLYTFDPNGKLTGAVINVPCPSQNSEHEWYLTADYWHNVRVHLLEKYGDIFILSQCAAAGDQSPRPLHYLKAMARRHKLKFSDYKTYPNAEYQVELYLREDISLQICNAFDEVLSWAKKELITDAPVCHSVKDIKLERWMISEAEYKSACEGLKDNLDFAYVNTGDPLADFKVNSTYITAMNRYKNIIQRYEEQKEMSYSLMELHTIRVGDIAFVSNPYELYQDYQHQIQARSPFVQTFVIQLCDVPGKGYLGGYLAIERAEDNLGYSANIFSNQVRHKGGSTLVNETVAELNRLYPAK